MTKNWS